MRDKYKVLWDEKAVAELNKIYDYIAQDSVYAARKVKKALIKAADKLKTFPEGYPREPYLSHLPQHYRFVMKWSYKIIFEVTADTVIVVSIFHTKQHPGRLIEAMEG